MQGIVSATPAAVLKRSDMDVHKEWRPLSGLAPGYDFAASRSAPLSCKWSQAGAETPYFYRIALQHISRYSGSVFSKSVSEHWIKPAPQGPRAFFCPRDAGRAQVQARPVAFDHAGLLEAPHALGDGRRAQVISKARAPPLWDACDEAEPQDCFDAGPDGDVGQHGPDEDMDQRVNGKD